MIPETPVEVGKLDREGKEGSVEYVNEQTGIWGSSLLLTSSRYYGMFLRDIPPKKGGC